MAYDNQIVRYDDPTSQTWTASDKTFKIWGPKGKAGWLWNYGAVILTTTAGGTTTPTMKVGDGSTADAYGKAFDLGAVTAPDYKAVRTSFTPATVESTYITKTSQEIVKDVAVVATMVAASGGGAAGAGTMFMEIRWER